MLTPKQAIRALNCCSSNPSLCGDCPLNGTHNCMNVCMRESMLTLERTQMRSPTPTEPPSCGSSVQPAKHLAWAVNLDSLTAGAFGDPLEPETLLRYWKAQEAAGYPYASENVKYFEEQVEKRKKPSEDLRSCPTCTHKNKPFTVLPCAFCTDFDKWEEDTNQ